MLLNAGCRISEEPYWFLNYWPEALVAWCALRGCDWDKHNTVSAAFACVTPLIKFLLSIFSLFFIFFCRSHIAPPALNSVHQHLPFSLFSSTRAFFSVSWCFPPFPGFLIFCFHFFPHIFGLLIGLSMFLTNMLIGFLFHLQSGEIDGPSLIINSRVWWKDPLLLNWFRPGKNSVVCFSYWWKYIAYSSSSVK